MKTKIAFYVILIISLSSLLTVLKGEAFHYDPKLSWKVVESPHFSIYFFNKPENQDNPSPNFNLNKDGCCSFMEQLAREIADLAEETYFQIHTQINLSPHHHMQKIGIILEDFTDYTLGYAYTFPHRVIRLSLTAPTAKSFDMKFKSWFKMVLVHEYTHIAHFEMTKGLTTALRALFGQIITPNGLQPTWALEGLAIYNETKFNQEQEGGGGRGIDPRYDMYLRMAILEDNLNTLDQISGYYLLSWPGGNAPYIYGQSIIHFIAQKYGEEKMIEISEVFCHYPYLGFNYAFKKVLALDLEELFLNWKEELQKRYLIQEQMISTSRKLTESKQLTNYHYWVDYPKWISFSSEGAEKIAVRVTTPHTYPFIQIIDPSSLSTPLSLTSSVIKKQSLIKRNYGRDSSFSFSPDGTKIIYGKLPEDNLYYQFYDLYLYNLENKREIRLSRDLRLKDPAWSPNPKKKQILAVINNLGTQNLVLINISMAKLSELSELSGLSRLSEQPELFELEGTKKITNKLTRPEQNNLLIQPEEIIYLTHFTDGTQIYQPAWSPRGDMVAFSAWRDGSQDIYLLTLTDDYFNRECFDLNNSAACSSQPQPIFLDRATDLNPAWSADGQYLFFSSDRSHNIYNIFAYSLSEQNLYQITNVLSGAFQPAPSPDGKKLAYIEYHSTGYELHLMNLEINPDRLAEIEISKSNTIRNFFNPIETDPTSWLNIKLVKNSDFTTPSPTHYPIHDYSPFASFWPPTHWIPAAQFSEKDLGVGYSTELIDVLGFNSLPLTITYGLINNTLNYDLNYYYYHYYPVLNLFFQGETDVNSFSANSGLSSWWKKGKAGINLYFQKQGERSVLSSPANSRSYQQVFSMGYQFEKTLLSSLASFPSDYQDDYQTIASLKLSYSYSDAEKYGFSISPEQGQSFSLSYEYADKILGSDYNFHKFIFEGKKYFPLPALHQVLALRLVAGYSSPELPEEEEFRLGGHFSSNNLSNSEIENFSLRGYKLSSQKGNNLLLASLEYRFPLANIEHSLKLGPLSLFLEKLSGLFFIDIGHAWENEDNDHKVKNNPINYPWSEFKTGIGMELKADFNWKFDSPFSLRLGFGKALSDPQGYDLYLTFGTSF